MVAAIELLKAFGNGLRPHRQVLPKRRLKASVEFAE